MQNASDFILYSNVHEEESQVYYANNVGTLGTWEKHKLKDYKFNDKANSFSVLNRVLSLYFSNDFFFDSSFLLNISLISEQSFDSSSLSFRLILRDKIFFIIILRTNLREIGA